MAKQRIAGALGLNGRVYRAGQEKELQAAATAAGLDLARHVQSGVLEGEWTGTAAAADEGAAVQPTVAATTTTEPAVAAQPKKAAKKTRKARK